MSILQIARRRGRRALLIPQSGNRLNPNLLFPLDQTDPGELDELIRAILAKQGVTSEAEIKAVVEKAERDSEVRLEVARARAEVRRLMEIKKGGGSLMQVGYRKWKQAFFPGRKAK